METRRLDNAGAPGVGHHRYAVQLRELSDTQALRDAAGPGDIRLDDVDLAPLQQLRETPARGVLLTTGDARLHGVGELAVAGDVVRPERLLNPIRSVLFEPAHLPDGVIRVRPAESDIEHQLD